MRTFEVVVDREVLQTATLVIQAETADAAENIAWQRIESGEELLWGPNNGPHISIGYVEEM